MTPKELLLFRIACCLVVFYGERTTFYTAVRRCRRKEDGESSKRYIVLTDQQLIDETSYPGRAGWAKKLSIWISDIYMSRAFGAVDGAFRKDGYLFVGDYMDGGYRLDEKGYQKSLTRFKSIFGIGPGIQTVYAAGNHDIGLKRDGMADFTHIKARSRFVENFGPTNQVVEFGPYDLIVIDAAAIAQMEQELPSSEEAWLSTIGSGDNIGLEVIDFLAKLRIDTETPKRPRILLTHIPFWRPLAHYCGPDREARHGIHQFYGENYQNMLRKGTTEVILKWVKPDLIFSGDDHDSCYHLHPPKDTPEHTVKAFSMAMGIKRPGFTVLDINQATDSAPSFRTTSCTLPDQIAIYTHFYAPLLIIVILILGIRFRSLGRLTTHLPLFSKSKSTTKYNGLHRLNGSSSSRPPKYSYFIRSTPRLSLGHRLRNSRVGKVVDFAKLVFQVAWPPITLFLFLAWISLPKGSMY